MTETIESGVRFEDGELGKRAALVAPWSEQTHAEILRSEPVELDLNTSKGWRGKDLHFLSDYKFLKSFSIIDMSIDDISDIHDLIGLTNLEIITYCNTNIDFSRFSELRKCSLEWRAGAESIFDRVELVELFLNGYTGKHSEPFGRLVNLRSLSIYNSSIVELHALSRLLSLRSLSLCSLRRLNSLDGIEFLNQLRSFTLHTCKSVGSIEQLSNLEALEEVGLNNLGKIDSLQPLGALTGLRKVIFYESTNVLDGDLTPIFSSPSVIDVSFQNRRHYSHKRQEFEGRKGL